MLAIFNKAVDAVVWLVRTVALLQATSLFVIIIATVVMRYGFNFVFSWSEEVPRYLLIWVGFLGAAAGVDAKDHVAFTLLHDKLKGLAHRLLSLLLDVGIFAFGAVLLVYGTELTERFGGDYMTSLPYTNVWFYTAAPVSGALMMLFSFRNQLNAWAGTERGPAPTPLYE
ncbi:TRAP transporter small permease [Acuticoccus yangtzensis]|uniref:TRAP transporter small permease n=1 Tax=Acuticoccus yangtzensis TaxID=1443441 RepID=UPI000949849D|nr:TRAP transporter small permease [Acuticoccus yangtzensis]ORE94232.1 tripartite ATP-independent periplasmic transporter DctQ component [Stappia sp. 22II-S9-Z10]